MVVVVSEVHKFSLEILGVSENWRSDVFTTNHPPSSEPVKTRQSGLMVKLHGCHLSEESADLGRSEYGLLRPFLLDFVEKLPISLALRR